MKSVIVDELDLKGPDWDKPSVKKLVFRGSVRAFKKYHAERTVTRGPLEVRGTEEERARK